MPIHPDNVHRYPPDWPAISKRIRTERAGDRCECSGQCGHDHKHENVLAEIDDITIGYLNAGEVEDQCRAVNSASHPVTGSKVVLTVAHLDHTPENVDETNLLALCQRCHLAYDRDHHTAERARRAAVTRERAEYRAPEILAWRGIGIELYADRPELRHPSSLRKAQP